MDISKSKIIDWFSQFDKIFILNLDIERKRREFMKMQLYHLGISNLPNIQWFISTEHPIEKMHSLEWNMHKDEFHLYRPFEYSCAREHYTIVKTSYNLGYKKILVMEDDIAFMKDLNALSKMLTESPEDADFLRFHACSVYDQALRVPKHNSSWNKDLFSVWNLSCTAYMTRKSMQYYVWCQDKKFQVADMPLYMASVNFGKIRSYLSRVPICIQEKSFDSKIRNSMNDRINYETDNVLEQDINKKDYLTLTEIDSQVKTSDI